MHDRGERMRALVLVGALMASFCACKGRAGSDPEHQAGTAGQPALWEPIDPDFKGCEGG